MARTKSEKSGWLEATETFVAVFDARPKKYRMVIVRDRHTGKLAEVPLTELPPEDEGSEGRDLLVKKGDIFTPDDEVVKHLPQHFRPTSRTP